MLIDNLNDIFLGAALHLLMRLCRLRLLLQSESKVVKCNNCCGDTSQEVSGAASSGIIDFQTAEMEGSH